MSTRVLGDAAAGEGDDALGQEVQEFVVAPERNSPSVAVPVRLADDLVDAVLLGPACGDALDAGASAVDQHHVGVSFRIPYAWNCRIFTREIKLLANVLIGSAGTV